MIVRGLLAPGDLLIACPSLSFFIAAESMSNITLVNTSIDEEGDILRQEFTAFLSNLLTTMSDKREQEELGILNSK